MINILIPLAGSNQFFNSSDYLYPKLLVEINQKTIIDYVINNLNSIKEEKQFIFIVSTEDIKKYHLHNILNLLTNHKCKIIELENSTKGALCSSLMAIDYINNEDSLLISNSDQLINSNLNEVIDHFKTYDGGVISFNSIHPRWSYVKLDNNGFIIQTAEKKPISKNAIAGFYYFKNGRDFCSSAMNVIRKDSNLNGLYYISSSLNEMVLDNKKLMVYELDINQYHTFYTPQKIKDYERLLQCQ